MQTVEASRKLSIPKAMIDYMEKSCVVDEIDGELYCKKCGNRVRIDWFEKSIECLGCDEL